MKLKRITAALLAGVMCVGLLAGCGSKGDGDEKGSGDKITIRLLTRMAGTTAQVDIYNDILDEFKEKHPEVTIVDDSQGDESAFNNILSTDIASGTMANIFRIQGVANLSEYIDNGLILDVQPYLDEDPEWGGGFTEGALSYYQVPGKEGTYAIPMESGLIGVYYNKDLFDKYGVEYPDENTTWEEFKDKCKQLTQDGNYGTVFASSLDYYDPQVLSLGGEIINEKGEFDITGDKTTAALQSLADLINVDKVAPKIADTANTVWNWEQFEGGNIGMLIDGPWTVTNVVNYCDFNVGYSIIPKAEKQVTTINGSALAVTSESKHPKEAYQALEVLTSPEAQKLLAENGRALPSRDSVRDYYYESTSEQEGLEDAIKKSIEIGMPYYVTKKYSEVSTVFNSGMDTVWAGEVSAEDAAKDIQAQVDMILQ